MQIFHSDDDQIDQKRLELVFNSFYLKIYSFFKDGNVAKLY